MSRLGQRRHLLTHHKNHEVGSIQLTSLGGIRDVLVRETLEFWSPLQPRFFDAMGTGSSQSTFSSHSHRIFTLLIAGENHPKTSKVLAISEPSRHFVTLEVANQQWWVRNSLSWSSTLCWAFWSPHRCILELVTSSLLATSITSLAVIVGILDAQKLGWKSQRDPSSNAQCLGIRN